MSRTKKLEPIQEAAKAIGDADALLIHAGAGMGVDSGLPDFRGNSGFWRTFTTLGDRKIPFRAMADTEWLIKDPGLVWAMYGHLYNLFLDTTPHAGFSILRKIVDSRPDGFFVLTSNIDGHFQRSGFDEKLIEECHGSMTYLQCSIPCTKKIWEVDKIGIRIDPDEFRALDPLPTCPHCGAIARPNTLMFGDRGWAARRSAQQAVRREEWLERLEEQGSSVCIIELGAGLGIPTVRNHSESLGRRLNARIIRVNPKDSEVPDGQISLRMGSLEALEKIAAYL